MGLGESVNHCHVPCKAFPTLPGNQCKPLRPFTVHPGEASQFLDSWSVGASKSTAKQVVHVVVADHSACVPSASKAVRAPGVDKLATRAGMGFTRVRPQA